MTLRTSRFGRGYDPYLVAQHEQQSSRVEIFTPTRGLHRGDAAQDLAPGFSPSVQNLAAEGGHILPRSGLSQFKGGSSHLNAPALGAWRVQDELDNNYAVVASTRSFSVFDPTTDSWSTLSYVKPSTSSENLPSGTSRDYWQGTYIYDASRDRNLGVFTNGVDVPKVATLKPSLATYSDLTDFASLASNARAVAAFDDRLVWWNVASSSSTYPTRVLWSPRGLPANYQLASGAGFQDLLDVRGAGTRVVADRDGLVLFTTDEVWGARRRGDAYVFDFYPIEREFGCPFPGSVARTSIGVVFLGRDFELYVVQSGRVQPLEPAEPGESSRIRSFLQESLLDAERVWSVYNATDQRYELYFTGSDSVEGYPTRALYYSINERAFWPQKLAHEVSAGVVYDDPGTPLTWDGSGELTFDDVATAWDNQEVAGTGYQVHAISSVGSAYRFYSTQTTDDGTAIEWVWTSHGMNRDDQMRYDRFTELWIEYKSEATSAVSVGFFANGSGQTVAVSLAPSTNARVLVANEVTGVSPQFRIASSDGGRPKIARFQARLSEGGLY